MPATAFGAPFAHHRDMNPEQSAAAVGATTLPPRLYVNQLVSSQLSWRELGLQLTMQADPFAPGTSLTHAPCPWPQHKTALAQRSDCWASTQLTFENAYSLSCRFDALLRLRIARPPGPTSTAEITFRPLTGNPFAIKTQRFTLMLRIPEWAVAAPGSASGSGSKGGATAKGSDGPALAVEVNGVAWSSCPGLPQPGSYCEVTR